MANPGNGTPPLPASDGCSPGSLVGAPGLRDDLFQLMNGLDRAAELEWRRVVSLPAAERASEFERIGGDHGCTQVTDDKCLLWLNNDERVESMFCFVDEPTPALSRAEANYWAFWPHDAVPDPTASEAEP